MNGRFGQRGESKIGCILGLIIFAAAILVAVKTVPVVINVGEFDSEIIAQAERAGLPRHSDKYIQGRLLQKAEELHLPVLPEQIKIKRRKTDIKIHVEYDLTLDYGFYTYHWHKVHDIERPIF